MSDENEKHSEKLGTPTPSNNVVSFDDWKAGKRPVTPAVGEVTLSNGKTYDIVEEKITGRATKTRKMKPPAVDNVARSLKAQSYLIEMYTDMLRLTVTALGEIERSNPASAKTSKIAHDAIATVGRIVNQVAIDLQEHENTDKNDK